MCEREKKDRIRSHFSLTMSEDREGRKLYNLFSSFFFLSLTSILTLPQHHDIHQSEEKENAIVFSEEEEEDEQMMRRERKIWQ